jgi:hypothetical protein
MPSSRRVSRALNVALRIVTQTRSSPISLKTAKCRTRLFCRAYSAGADITMPGRFTGRVPPLGSLLRDRPNTRVYAETTTSSGQISLFMGPHAPVSFGEATVHSQPR